MGREGLASGTCRGQKGTCWARRNWKLNWGKDGVPLGPSAGKALDSPSEGFPWEEGPWPLRDGGGVGRI